MGAYIMIGFAIGFVLGAATGTAFGAFTGAMIGMTVGFTACAFRWARIHLGDSPTVETHRVMCTPFGQAADIQFEGDLGTGRWSDVRRCTLLHPADQVDCDKGCLRQLQLAGVRPGKPCSCHEAA